MFIGISGKDYVSFLEDHEVNVGAFTGTGNETSTACGRLAFLFDATGAAVTIDTACSSSLVAVNMALRQTNIYHKSEEFAAITAGISLITPRMHLTLGLAGMLAPDNWNVKLLTWPQMDMDVPKRVVLYFFKTKMIKA